MSKLCMERVARSFARRFEGVDIYVLRLGAVITPDEHQQAFRDYVKEPEKWKGHGWSYVDVRDLAEMCRLCVEVDGLGFQVFNATNDEITNLEGTEGFLRRMCPDTKFTRAMGEREAPISNWKIKKMLGFKEAHNWQRYYNGDE
jgi:nucleoside-diphosphate-sugar epimerase